MAIMYKEIASQRPRCEIIDAASAVGHISHNNRLNASKPEDITRSYPNYLLFQDVRDNARVGQQTLREL